LIVSNASFQNLEWILYSLYDTEKRS